MTKTRNIKIVIFDLDGTLVNAYYAITDSINFMLGEMGLPPQSYRTVKRSVGWGVDSLVGCFVPPQDVPKGLAIFRRHHDKRLRENVRLLSGVKTLLPFLKKKGCILAIASNRPTQFCHIILKTVGIDHYFDEVICGDAVKRPKPAPDMVKAILKKTGVRPCEALYVGDMSVDIRCAKSAGVLAVAVPTGSCTRQEILAAKPDLLIERLGQIRKIVGR